MYIPIHIVVQYRNLRKSLSKMRMRWYFALTQFVNPRDSKRTISRRRFVMLVCTEAWPEDPGNFVKILEREDSDELPGR